MNLMNFSKQKIAVQWFALLTIVSLVLSAFPAAFFVAEAASNGITLSRDEIETSVSTKENFVVTVTYETEKTEGTYISVDDNSGGGFFYTGTTGGDCNSNSPDPDSLFAITENKGVCYSNDVPGEYLLTIQLLTAIDGEPIGESKTIDFKVEEEDESHKVDICHWNGQTFELLNVAKSSIGNAHGSQGVNDGDIIPAFDEYEGQNLEEDYNGSTGAEVLENDCVVPEVEECEEGYYGEYPDCEPVVVYGCMDGNAINFNPLATEQGEVACEYYEMCENLLTNGSFEDPVVTHEADWDKFLNVTGWIIEQVNGGASTTLELHRDWFSNEAANGLQYAELDGDHATKISQTKATIPGAEYVVTWAFAPRHAIDAAENKLSVKIDGLEVASNGPAAGMDDMTPADWTYGSYNFTADDSTTVTFADAGANSDSYGTFLDAAQLCLVREPEPEMCEITMVSDEGTVVVENNAFAVPTYNSHPNWTASVPGATWVWETFFVQNPLVDTTKTFEETFIVDEVETAVLTVAADNSYKVFINDVEVGGDAGEYNFRAGDEDVYPDLTSYIVDGENTLRIEVKNWALGDSTPESNPAGVLYKLVVTAKDECEVTTDTDEPPVEDTYRIEGYKYEVLQGEEFVPVAGWNIYAYNSDDATSLATTTDVNGYYWFEVEEGTWEVTEEIPEGWEQFYLEQDGYGVQLDSGVLYCLFELYEEEWDEYYKPVAFGYSQDEDSDSNCDFYNYQLPEEEDEVNEEEPQEETRSSGRSSGTKTKKPKGEVAGASTDFCPFLTEYMQIGTENNPAEVMKLQMFLNIFVASTSVTGVFDETTDAHVKIFQEQYRDEILEPWFKLGIVPHNQPTGFVYKLTRWKINSIVCPGSEPYPTIEGEDLLNNIDLD